VLFKIAIPLDMHGVNFKKLWKITTYIYVVACRVVSRQRLGKHIPTATDTNAKIEVLSETGFCNRSVQMSYEEDN
jgi:hypothetical protein